MYLKKILIFTPIFLLFYGVNTYGLHAKSLYLNPFGELETEKWVQESPIQYFVGFFINLIVKNTTITHWIVVGIGFVYFLISTKYFDKNYFKNFEILKILYFTPFFLILFSWMGKPDTFTIGSLLFLVAFSSSVSLSFTFIIFLIFSHPQVSIIYILLIKYLNIFKIKTIHYFSFVVGFLTYFIYLGKLSTFESRFNVISNEIIRAFNTIFTNFLGGLISLFMWLWIIIFISNLIKDKKFIFSFLFIFLISFFTIDHTRIFTLLSVPIIIYLINHEKFILTFKNLFDKKIMYLLGIFQIQKRADGKLVDGWSWINFDFVNSLVQRLASNINEFIEIFSR